MKTIKVNCKTCGEVELGKEFTDANEEQFIVPVVYAKTFNQLGRIYKKITGASYEENTGNKIKDDFIQKIEKLFHSDFDDTNINNHSIGEHLCWKINL